MNLQKEEKLTIVKRFCPYCEEELITGELNQEYVALMVIYYGDNKLSWICGKCGKVSIEKYW